jgi:hypothetical protein
MMMVVFFTEGVMQIRTATKKDLDTILSEIPTIENKNALKTKKYKCMEALRNSAQNIYNKYLNS